MFLNWEQNENDISEESPHWKKEVAELVIHFLKAINLLA